MSKLESRGGQPLRRTENSSPEVEFNKFVPLNTTWEQGLIHVQSMALFKGPKKLKGPILAKKKRINFVSIIAITRTTMRSDGN